MWFDLFLLAVLFLRQFFHWNYIIKTIRLRLNDGLEIWDVPLYKIILSRELFIKPRAIWSPHNFITPFWQTSTNHYILELTLAWLQGQTVLNLTHKTLRDHFIESGPKIKHGWANSSILGSSLARYFKYCGHDRRFVCTFTTPYTTRWKMELPFWTM